MKIITIGLSLAALISISGCAGRVVHEGKFARDDGWYKGTVLQTGSADSLKRPAFYDCRKTDPMTSATQEYALIAFRRNGHPYARVAPVSGRVWIQRRGSCLREYQALRRSNHTQILLIRRATGAQRR